MNKEVIYSPKEEIRKAVNKFETPFFLYEEEIIRKNAHFFKSTFEKYFKDFWPFYSVKANPNPEIIKIVLDEGFDLDCSSPSEIWIGSAISNRDPIGIFSGNYNSEKELELAKKEGLIINLDSIYLIDKLRKIGAPEIVFLRINPGVESEAGGNIELKSNILGGPDAKFGIPYQKAPDAFKKLEELGVKKFGMHMMTGSNSLDENYFANLVKKCFDIIRDVKESTGIEIDFMNIGGGFGVPYRPSENNLNIEKTAKLIRDVFDRERKKGLKEPILMVEPGRYLTANAAWLIGKVICIKDGYKKFVGIDASTNNMPRPSIYDAYHHISTLSKSQDKQEVSIVGRLCENNDQLGKDRLLPKLKEGDVVVIHNSGAHAYAMAHNYNGRPRSAEYLIRKDGRIDQIRRSETIKDLFRTVDI